MQSSVFLLFIVGILQEKYIYNGSDSMSLFSPVRWKYIHNYMQKRTDTAEMDVGFFCFDIAKYHIECSGFGKKSKGISWRAADTGTGVPTSTMNKSGWISLRTFLTAIIRIVLGRRSIPVFWEVTSPSIMICQIIPKIRHMQSDRKDIRVLPKKGKPAKRQ